ncbi:MAG: hypothetical protein ACE5HT_15995 [Gemmatimonadales bacterium]
MNCRLSLALLLPVVAVPSAGAAGSGGPLPHNALTPVPYFCATGPEYYRIALVSTKRVPGSGRASGFAEVFYEDSPFGLAVAPDGSYVQRLELTVDGLKPARNGAYVVWASTMSLDRVKPLGVLDGKHRLGGRVTWNKFLVVISLEPAPESLGAKWSGPIVMRGMSRSGLMHTLAGHGPFQQEKCPSVEF